MKTYLNGEEAEWPEAVRARFAELMAERPPANVTTANYASRRPRVDEYDRGSDEHGFVYTIDGRRVCYIWLAGPDLVKRGKV